jgi:hypothetical protein
MCFQCKISVCELYEFSMNFIIKLQDVNLNHYKGFWNLDIKSELSLSI